MKIMLKKTVRRKALIIQNPGENVDFRSGVLIDVAQIQAYLHSNIGGAWEKHEITLAPQDWTLSEIGGYFDRTVRQTDYYLIFFTGHGDYDMTCGPRCGLLNGECLTHEWLRQMVCQTPALFITDSCQGIEILKEGGTAGRRQFSVADDANRRCQYRQAYDDILRQLPSGMFVVGSSVSPGEYAADDPKLGGYYIHSLIMESMRINDNVTAQPGVYGIGYIHHLAARDVGQMSQGRQTPYLTGYNRTYQPPFMVRL